MKARKCIIVDDNDANRIVAGGFVENIGFQVEEVSNGHDAILLLEKGGVEVALIDWHMPEMSGIELLEIIDKRKWNYKITTILYSGIEDESAINEAYEAGAASFIPKPISEEKVKKAFIKAGLLEFPDNVIEG